jgi:hypothetical protein
MITYDHEDENFDIDQSSFSHEQPLEIKTTLIKTEVPKKLGNRIIEESKIILNELIMIDLRQMDSSIPRPD